MLDLNNKIGRKSATKSILSQVTLQDFFELLAKQQQTLVEFLTGSKEKPFTSQRDLGNI